MIVAGNWKMNGSLRQGKELLAALVVPQGVEVIVCPPATLLGGLAASGRSDLQWGGQDCHAQPSGAFTGDIAAEMLAEVGASFVLVGHSERRQLHGETSGVVREKALAAQRAGLKPILCIGETLAEREAGKVEQVLAAQLSESLPESFTADAFILAYEPIWAIGTGKVASLEMIAAVHNFLISRLPGGGKLLYGGSVNAENAGAILSLPQVHGVLVGGASLKAESFNAIIRAAQEQSRKT